MLLFALAVLAAFAVYVMKPEERMKLFGRVRTTIYRAQDTAIAYRQRPDAFRDALRERTPWPVVTPAFAMLSVLIFVGMLFGDGALSNPETLVAWGGSVGPRTTNGEWWRLVAALFVHAGILHLLVNVGILVQLGLLLERLVGSFAFATVYLAAGVFANLASLSADPMAVNVGTSGAVFGLYGLLLASCAWALIRRSPVRIPLPMVKVLGAGAAVFLLYNLATGGFERGVALNGLVMGFVCGLALSHGVTERKPQVWWVAGAMAATAVVAVASAVPMRGLTDVKPEIERIMAIEDRTARAYETEVNRFTNGVSTAEALAQLINGTIIPELRAARARLKALDGVPRDHQPLVASAEEYLQLRDESWRLRAEGLHNHSMPTLRRADRTERASLEILEKIRPPDPK